MVLALIFVMPAWDALETRRLKASADPRKRTKWYLKVIVVSWALALLVTWTSGGWRQVMTIDSYAPWMPSSGAVRGFVVGLIVAIVAVQVFLLLQIRKKPEARAKLMQALATLYFILPVTREDRRWFFLVSLTAGICEEVVYRGFLIHYLMGAPASLSVTFAVLVASLIFGLGHIYQGVRGAIGTAVLGCVFAVLFVITGNLAISILLHAIIDARILLMLPEGLDLAPTVEA
jgi:membrane protease YdiL (CAAX protease family)